MSTNMIVDKDVRSMDPLRRFSKNLWNKAENPGAFAVERLAKGTTSRIFEIQKDSGAVLDLNFKVEIGIYNGSLGVKIEGISENWYKYIGIAPDVHSANVHLDIIQYKEHQSYCLEVIKNIEKNEELFLWFSEKLAAIIDMPFLTPKNIIGHKKYRCHSCNKNFEHPNPLKIHLFMSCNQELKPALWQKIKCIINQKYIINSSVWNIQDPILINERSYSEPPHSAFLPYKKIFKHKKEDVQTIQPLNLTVGSSMQQTLQHPRWMSNVLELKLSRSLEEVSGNYAADVELFASNWGKLKQGHLCVYCGKVYSRKYGLKIHIRTHTGYKPLKCKYCLRPFGDPSNLNKHVRLHASNLTQYMCSLCGKVLVRRRDLERHLKSQHGSEDGILNDGVKEQMSD